jgi:hypothetical protein
MLLATTRHDTYEPPPQDPRILGGRGNYCSVTRSSVKVRECHPGTVWKISVRNWP